MRTNLGPIILFLFTAAFCAAIVLIPTSCKPGIDCADPKNTLSLSCVAQIAVDCAGGNVQGAITQYSPEVKKTIEKARRADGSIDWGSIEDALIHNALQFGGCVVATVFDDYINGKAVDSGSGSAVAGLGSGSGLGPSPARIASSASSAAAKAAFDRVKAKAFPGKTFKTARGTL